MSASLCGKLFFKCKNIYNYPFTSFLNIKNVFIHTSSSSYNKSLFYVISNAKCQRCSILLRNQLNYGKTYILYNNTVRSMAGHAKWQNVAHIKQEKNTEKAKLANKYVRLVRMAVRDGGPDPKLNNRLAEVIAEAHKNNVPSSTLQNALKASSSKKITSGIIELFGPGGCFLVLDYETDNVSNFRFSVKGVLKKYGLAIPQGEGRWRACFEEKGLIKVIGTHDGEPLNPEKALDSAIEAGAEDVQLNKDDNETPYLEFFCSPDDLHPVKKELEIMNYKIEEAYIAYIPNVMVKLSEDDMQHAGNLINELENMSDVIRIYENIQ